MFLKALGLFVALSVPAGASALMEAAAGKHDAGNTIVLSADVKCLPAASYDLWATTEGATKFFAPKAEIGDSVGGPTPSSSSRPTMRKGSATARSARMC